MSKTPPFDLTRRGQRQASTTSPIYARGADGSVESIGTGVFFEHRDRKVVLTASHVLRGHINTHELIIAGGLAVGLNQRWFRSLDEDAYDIAFVPLSNEQASILADVAFVTQSDVDLSEDCTTRPHYLLVYRSDDNAPEGPQDRLVAGWSIYAVRSASPEMYAARRLSPTDQMLLMFNRRLLLDPDGPVDPEPAPEGMSGSGVWRIGSDLWSDKLAAIVGSHSDDGNVIYATRFRVLLQALDDYVDGRLA